MSEPPVADASPDGLPVEPLRPRSLPPWIHLLVAAAAVLAVAFGLRFGASPSVRAAIVFGAPASGAGAGLAWTLVVLEGDRGARSPLARFDVAVSARAGSSAAEWRGTTNEDGVAEALLAFPAAPLPSTAIDIEVRNGDTVLAIGRAAPPHVLAQTPALPWMPFAQRTGPIALDVAVPSGRAAPGFATPVWVRATEAAGPSRGARVADVDVDVEPEASVASAVAQGRTDPEGWEEIDVVPVGLAVALHLTAKDRNGRTGEWIGGLTMSPGAANLATRDRVSPGESPAFDVTWPTARTAGYVEIDDAAGRAWATTSLAAHVTAPPLPAGLYWVVASGDPGGATSFGPGSIARAFAVAGGDDAALAYGADRDECGAPGDPRVPARQLASCLAVTPLVPAPRWVALDGFVGAHARDAAKRAQGLAVAVGAVFTAMALETVLLLRVALSARAGLRSASSVVAGVLVAALGFLLLAAFLLRAA
ncbi:MAG TPA: hypothetical protein VK841_19830 [Polyangiaceae bacterium]|jgi:hypothetical protein|nr:hypothetical protein [Polyangiaceae bacterium]